MSRVWVVGSVNADVVVWATRLPRPGETVAGTAIDRGLGGKGANQAVASARLGADVAFVGAVGDDADGTALRTQLAGEGIDVADLVVVDGPTGVAVVLVEASGENAIVVVPGANGAVDAARASRPAFDRDDLVVAQGELPLGTVAAALGAARAAGATTLWNPAPATVEQRDHLHLADVVVVNESELATLAGVDDLDPDDHDAVAAALATLAATSGGDAIATLGAEGVVAMAGGTQWVVPARRVEVVDTTGAGDCFVGALAASLAAGDPLSAAVDRAVVAASLAVGVPGASASMPTAAAVASAASSP